MPSHFPRFSSPSGNPAPVFCEIFPDFSSLFKIPWLFPDWKMPSHFSSFPVRVGTLNNLHSGITTFLNVDTEEKCGLEIGPKFHSYFKLVNHDLLPDFSFTRRTDKFMEFV